MEPRVLRIDQELLQPGSVLAESADDSFWSKLVAWFTRSEWTHVSLIVDNHTIIEAAFPRRVRYYPLASRVAEIQQKDRQLLILDPIHITDEQRAAVAIAAAVYVGRLYDVLQCVLYGMFRRFFQDGPKRVICSRLITAIYNDLGLDGFHDYCTPAELVASPAMSRVYPKEAV